MASLCLNSLPLPPSSQPRRVLETSLIITSNGHLKGKALKPIVVSGNPPTFVSAPGRRIVAVGDLHGDLDQARCALGIAGVLSSDGQDLWTGRETVLVQLGDILDRGEDEIAVLSLLRSLDLQAKAQGGAVFQVNGNHETMNVEGDFRYVDPGAYDECSDFLEYLGGYRDDWEEGFVNWVGVSERWKQERKMSQNNWGPWNLVKRQKGVIARSILLRPGGKLACELARHAVVLKVNDWVFCHGGLLPHHVAYGIERMNREVSLWMRGLSETQDGPPMPFLATKGYDSVVWNRLYSRDTLDLEDYQLERASISSISYSFPAVSDFVFGVTDFKNMINATKLGSIKELDILRMQETFLFTIWRIFSVLLVTFFSCLALQINSILEETLQAIDAKAMVVGHTPQTTGVNCKYNCSIWRIDVGMSSGVLNSRPEVLEIRDNRARVIRSKRNAFCELQAVDYT